MTTTTTQAPKFSFKKKIPLMKWFYMKEQEVLDTFASLPNAVHVGKKGSDQQFVYVPGTREDKVLLVAHADTTNSDRQVNVRFSNGTYYSVHNNNSCGADDRAGCAILWNLRDSGHSLLIPNGEESGCVGSRFLMSQEDWAKRINDEHRFAVQFDRRGSSDLVFYHVGSAEFVKWCEANFTGYKKSMGSFTDIGQLCRTICGVNISVGYYGEHGNKEKLVEREWHRTLTRAREVLEKTDLPSFEQDKDFDRPTFDHDDFYFGSAYGIGVGCRVPDKKEPVMPYQIQSSFDWMMICPKCKAVMDVSEYNRNHEKCLYCKEPF